MKNFTQTPEHKKLLSAARELPHLKEILAQDAREYLKFENKFLKVDFSKQKVTKEILENLINLTKTLNLQQAKENYFNGIKINTTENRAVLHTALRLPGNANKKIYIDGVDIVPQLKLQRQKLFATAERIRKNKNIKSIISIGIGGSDLGPKFIYDAFQDLIPQKKIYFVSNVDGLDLTRALGQCIPAETAILVASKTFTTIETMLNAKSALLWSRNNVENFFALTASPKAAEEFGIKNENILEFSDWVGGRFSVWSSIGLPIVIAFGQEFFENFLKGAHKADEDFLNEEPHENISTLMALFGLWNRNYLGYQTHILAPYDVRLRLFSKYIQQMDMESNGKTIDREGNRVNYKTAPQIYGEAGTDCQHSYMQLLHQGSDISPVDFLGVENTGHDLNAQHHKILLANMRAQAKALAVGQTLDEAQGDSFKVCEGNRPSSSFLFKELNPESLGYLIALYEHKIFVQGHLWNLNSYDQPGVELGKKLAKQES